MGIHTSSNQVKAEALQKKSKKKFSIIIHRNTSKVVFFRPLRTKNFYGETKVFYFNLMWVILEEKYFTRLEYHE
jgi:hypothetical protein